MPPRPALRFKTEGFSKALGELRKFSKRDFTVLLKEQARGVVRRLVNLTPPAQGKADSQARKRGETAVAADLARIFRPVSQSQIDKFQEAHGSERADSFGHKGAKSLGQIYTRVLQKSDLTSFHQARRRGDGRVMQVNGDATTGLRKRDLRGLDKGLVETKTYQWFKRRVQERVGLLGAGWNRAAQKLGYNPPQWIKRHGEGRGDCTISLSGERMRIRVTNDVPFAGTVKNIHRRVNQAIAGQAEAMRRRVEHFVKKAAQRAGFKSR